MCLWNFEYSFRKINVITNRQVFFATRNLLMDIPSIDKTVFLIDRKDLDTQTKLAFQSYAENDTIDVDDTDYVDTLIRRMTDLNHKAKYSFVMDRLFNGIAV